MFGWSPNGETNFERNAAKMNGFDFPIRNWILLELKNSQESVVFIIVIFEYHNRIIKSLLSFRINLMYVRIHPSRTDFPNVISHPDYLTFRVVVVVFPK